MQASALILPVEIVTASVIGKYTTKDRVFVLSCNEYQQYGNPVQERAYPTKYAVAQSNPFFVFNDDSSSARITMDTSVSWIFRMFKIWQFAREYHERRYYYRPVWGTYTDQMFVRPALWVRTQE